VWTPTTSVTDSAGRGSMLTYTTVCTQRTPEPRRNLTSVRFPVPSPARPPASRGSALRTSALSTSLRPRRHK
jgi:hypothetical protein